MRVPPSKHRASSTSALLANPFDRFDIGDGLSGWVYGFSNRDWLPIPQIVTAASEIAVQFAGEWALEVWGKPAATFGPGDVFTVPAGVRHTYHFRAREEPGLQVGFAVEAGPPEWRATRLDGREAADFRELAHAVVAWRTGRTSIDGAAVCASVHRLASDWRAPRPGTGLDLARKELEETFARPLYLEHVAATARMHPRALSRAFLREVGVSPIRFRTELRLQHAIRRLWSRVELSVEHIATDVGFEDKRLLHRLCVATFGLTPAELGRRARAVGSSGR